MKKKDAQKLVMGQAYQATYKDNHSYSKAAVITFVPTLLTDNGTTTKLYIETENREHIFEGKVRGNHSIHWLGLLDVAYLTNVTEVEPKPHSGKVTREIIVEELKGELVMKDLTRAELKKMNSFKNLPDSFIPTILKPVGIARFHGGAAGGDADGPYLGQEQFDKNTSYAVYDYESVFVVGKDGQPYKMIPAWWGPISLSKEKKTAIWNEMVMESTDPAELSNDGSDPELSKISGCQCLYEIENKLPRTKFCHIPCKAQRNLKTK